MILGNIFHKEACKTESIELNSLIQSLKIPSEKDWAKLTAQELTDWVRQIPVNINENLNRLAESHLICADLHLVLEGTEIHKFWNSIESVGPQTEFIEDDNIFYPSIDESKVNLIHLFPGDFIVYWPGEIHSAGTGNTCVRKIVYKIKV
jgi:YhcH/YjgK/YiaL family protein